MRALRASESTIWRRLVVKAARSFLLLGLAVWPMGLMMGQEPAPAAGGRVTIFDGSRRMVTVDPSAGAPALSSLPGTHVQRVGQWGVPGRVYSRKYLLENIWDYTYGGYDRTIDSHINRLRAKVEDDPDEPKLVLTVWGVGYKFNDEY